MQQPNFTAIICILDVVYVNVVTTCIIINVVTTCINLILYAGLSYCISTRHCNEK
jgi:hypothetical protein